MTAEDAGVKFTRVWAMPDSNTFNVIPIHNFVRHYLSKSKVSIDPFARNNRWATYTNDINPKTESECHLEAGEFFDHLRKREVKADLLLFDPPYSPRQLKECYDSVGRKMQMEDGQTARLRSEWRDAALGLLTDDAVVLTFGWNSTGFGKRFGFQMEEILLVCHGADHNDTICVAERRFQPSLFGVR